MKKRILTLIFAFVICIASALTSFASESKTRLYDGANLLTAGEEATIIARLDEISKTYKVDVIIATVESTGNYTADEYVEYYYDSGDYGFGDTRDGVLLLLDMGGRNYRILSNGIGADAITPDDIDSIGENISPWLSDGDYAYAFELFADDCEFYINGHINGFPYDFPVGITVSLVIGFIVAFIVTAIMKGQLKSVRRQPNAACYTKKDSMKITNANDFYLYRNVIRTKIETKTSSSGRVSSSRNVGGGKF